MRARYSQVILAAVVPLFVSACAVSSTYKPKRDGRIHLVVKEGDIALEQNGRVVGLREDFVRGLTWDPRAFDRARVAALGLGLAEIGLAGGNSPVAAGVGSVFTLYLLAGGMTDQERAKAILVDAVNVHNDALARKAMTKSCETTPDPARQ